MLILLLFIKSVQDIKVPPPHGKEKKISLNLKQIVTPPAVKPKPQPKPVLIIPPVPKPQVQAIKKKVLDDSKKIFAEKSTEDNNVSKIEKKIEKKIVKKEVKKRVVKKTRPKRKPKRSKDPLANMLMSAGTSMVPTPRQSRQPSSSGSYGEKMIQNLYGGEFNTYSPTQKKFIRNNLGTIHRITQRTLTRNGYPSVAVRTRQQGTNVVSFYLHPNGDISGLKLKTPIGYATLDKNTLEVIRIAYKNYPLPNKKTRIVFYVTYTLY